MKYKKPYTLYKRGSYWYYRTYTPDGLRTSGISTGCKLKSDAKRFCDKLQLSNGLLSNNKTFKDYAIHFFDADSPFIKDRSKPLSYSTMINYTSRLKTVIMPYFQDKKLCDINYSLLKAFRIYLIENYSYSYVIITMNILKTIISSAYRDRIINENPFSYLERLGGEKGKRDAFTYDELKTLYKNIDKRFKPTIMILALTGMRISEVRGVELTNIKTTEKNNLYIYLETQLYHSKRIPLKSKKPRDIPIIPEIKELIPLIFKKNILPFNTAIKNIASKMNDFEKRKLSAHSIRHFFITNSKANNIPDIKVECIAGHSLKGITGVYTNFKADDLSDILEWQRKIYNDFNALDMPL